MIAEIRMLKENIAKVKKQSVTKAPIPELTASQVNTSIADAIEKPMQPKQANPPKADLSLVPPQFSDILNYSNKPPAN